MSTSSKIISKSISFFSISCKKKGVENISDIPEDQIVRYIIDTNDLFPGISLNDSEYIPTIQYFIGVIEQFTNNNETVSHVTDNIDVQIRNACNTFLNDNNKKVVQIILPKNNKIKYTDNDCDHIRNIINSTLNVKYKRIEYIK